MNLKKLFQIQKVLKDAGYFDISRISKEIYTYSQGNKIKTEEFLERIKKDEPWEYIRGCAEFRGSDFSVTKDTLIPRIETEQIVDIALSLIKKNDTPYSKIIDVGTGSGAIIISLYKELENSSKKEKRRTKTSFIATDNNKKALEVARENAKNHSITNISFLEKDLIGKESLEDYSLILANLPYIPTDMYEKLDKSVKEYEPKNALDGGKDGLKYYKKLLGIIEASSKKNIDLVAEIEPSTLKNFKNLVTKERKLEVIKDFREKNRFLLLHFS